MKRKTDYYPQYKKLMQSPLEKTIIETTEYAALAQHHPHLAESIKLKAEMKKLEKQVNLTRDRSTKRRINEEINEIKATLKRKNISARIHGESSIATRYRVHFAVDTLREHIQRLITKGSTALIRTRKDSQRQLHRLAHRRLPPSVFDLKSLDVAEKHMAVAEWVRNRRKQNLLAQDESVKDN